jgi:hypothetical protein
MVGLASSITHTASITNLIAAGGFLKLCTSLQGLGLMVSGFAVLGLPSF